MWDGENEKRNIPAQNSIIVAQRTSARACPCPSPHHEQARGSVRGIPMTRCQPSDKTCVTIKYLCSGAVVVAFDGPEKKSIGSLSADGAPDSRRGHAMVAHFPTKKALVDFKPPRIQESCFYKERKSKINSDNAKKKDRQKGLRWKSIGQAHGAEDNFVTIRDRMAKTLGLGLKKTRKRAPELSPSFALVLLPK